MQPIAAWLVARPQNGVIGLAVAILFPLAAPMLSGLVMAHLVFATGIRRPVVQGLVAGSLVALFALLLSASVAQIVASALIWWVPALLLAALARHWRSVTLAMQVSVILALAVTLGFFVVLGDPSDYWNAMITTSIELARQAGLHEQADMLSQSQSLVVPQMTMLFVSIAWSFYASVALLGYALFQALPGKAGIYGRFCELNLGRVLAMTMAVASVGALVTDIAWLRNVGFVAFTVFWLQGLAIVHWLYEARRLPFFVLVLVYAMMPFLNVLLVITLAIAGYTDAWFDFRARGKIKDDRI